MASLCLCAVSITLVYQEPKGASECFISHPPVLRPQLPWSALPALIHLRPLTRPMGVAEQENTQKCLGKYQVTSISLLNHPHGKKSHRRSCDWVRKAMAFEPGVLWRRHIHPCSGVRESRIDCGRGLLSLSPVNHIDVNQSQACVISSMRKRADSTGVNLRSVVFGNFQVNFPEFTSKGAPVRTLGKLWTPRAWIYLYG